MHVLGIGTKIQAGETVHVVTGIAKDGVTITEERRPGVLSNKHITLSLLEAEQLVVAKE